MINNIEKIVADHNEKILDKWSSYLDVYEKEFEIYKDKHINILEIGVSKGGSLELWAKYFPNAKNIIGIDIDTNCRKIKYADDRIKIYIGDANDPDIINKIINKYENFTIIIDDGSHDSADIIKSFFKWFPFLDNQGVYLAEDLHCSYFYDFHGGIDYEFSSINFFKRLVDVINFEFTNYENREDIIRRFKEHYNTSINNNELTYIKNIKFYNSICVINKNASNINKIGQRITKGKGVNKVDSAINSLNLKQYKELSSHIENKSNIESKIQEIIILKGQLELCNKKLCDLHNSRSFRLFQTLKKITGYNYIIKILKREH